MNDEHSLIIQLIQKHKEIIGPLLAAMLARKVAGLKIADNGDVLEISGDPKEALERLINVYASFTGNVTQLVLKRVRDAHPEARA